MRISFRKIVKYTGLFILAVPTALSIFVLSKYWDPAMDVNKTGGIVEAAFVWVVCWAVVVAGALLSIVAVKAIVMYDSDRHFEIKRKSDDLKATVRKE